MTKYALAAPVLWLALLAPGCRPVQPLAPASAAVDSSKYYAILLSNGAVYFGHLEGLGSPFPVLKEVYYVQTTQNPDTKAVSNVLIKRGKEWHQPDRMIINASSIVFVEPVGADSKVAQLIAESKR